MANNILDPAALLRQLPDLLPQSNKTLTSAHDAISVLIHTAFTTLGFRLVATDDVSPASPHPNSVLPDDWNTKGLVDRTFRYKHEQSSLEFLVKVIKLGQRTLINAIAVESDKSASLDISTNDFTSPSFYPHDVTRPDAPPLVHGFISPNRISDFICELKLKIIQKLIPGLRKEGYVEQSEDASTNVGPPASRSVPVPVRPRPATPPCQIPYGPHSHILPENPLEIGRRDLEPFGGNPFAPPTLHPIFDPRGSRPDDVRGPWAGDGYLPPMGAPPGARFDPIVPGPGPLNRFPPGFRRGAPRRGSGEPDNDEFMPPGVGDMFM
ncbi:PI31 proteasome regulator N-terminal-domain-containing protein [Pisolithus orientalis]|uniref:PI31 proteasome regulator N-terminal-domain-containing protein n=1 Tax=Pisolithus orientalis TaxID=936130 RepID=UPI00222569E2|nr:PI31 proteasome regulator N-terminal-domain-containing protein [Pisolithus orientalis]KAI6035263.1 PI31 proteasome regulator N-terminal-domain-containing protein [Pisolithus orientalis]